MLCGVQKNAEQGRFIRILYQDDKRKTSERDRNRVHFWGTAQPVRASVGTATKVTSDVNKQGQASWLTAHI